MQPTHDPPDGNDYGLQPDVPYTDDQVLMPRMFEPRDPQWRAQLIDQRARTLASPIYRVLATQLGEDPMNLVLAMATGKYRWRRLRTGCIVFGREGAPEPDLMSFRVVELELDRLTGGNVVVTYETLRRWWNKIFPDVKPPGGIHAPESLRQPLAAQRGNPAIEARTVAAQPTGEVPPATFIAPPAAAA